MSVVSSYIECHVKRGSQQQSRLKVCQTTKKSEKSQKKFFENKK